MRSCLGATESGEKTRLWQICHFPLIRKSDLGSDSGNRKQKGKRMFKKVLREIVRVVAAPLGRRLGTAFAVYLIAKGVPQDVAEQLLTALGVVAGLSADIIAAYIVDKRRAG